MGLLSAQIHPDKIRNNGMKDSSIKVKLVTSKIKKKHNFQSRQRSIHSDIDVWYTIIISAHIIIQISESIELL